MKVCNTCKKLNVTKQLIGWCPKKKDFVDLAVGSPACSEWEKKEDHIRFIFKKIERGEIVFTLPKQGKNREKRVFMA